MKSVDFQKTFNFLTCIIELPNTLLLKRNIIEVFSISIIKEQGEELFASANKAGSCHLPDQGYKAQLAKHNFPILIWYRRSNVEATKIVTRMPLRFT